MDEELKAIVASEEKFRWWVIDKLMKMDSRISRNEEKSKMFKLYGAVGGCLICMSGLLLFILRKSI